MFFGAPLTRKTAKKLYIAKQTKMLMIETLNVTLVTYLGGFIQYWLHKNILVVLWASWFLQIANRMLVIKATFLMNKAKCIY